MSGTRTVPYGREDRRLLHVSFSQDVLPKPIYQLILSEDYNNRIIPYFYCTGNQNQVLTSICLRIKNHLSYTHPAAAHLYTGIMPVGPRALRYRTDAYERIVWYDKD